MLSLINRILRKIDAKLTIFRVSRFGNKSYVFNPIKITDSSTVLIGNNSIVNKYSWFHREIINESQPELTIGNGVNIGHFSHIVYSSKLEIHDGVLIADKVFICDCTHDYIDITKSPSDREVLILNSNLTIGENTWIGESVSILGASIGSNCVVGANSVVTKNIPNNCIVAGNPAKIIKKYDQVEGRWIKITK